MNDVINKDNIKELVNSFYPKIIKDELVGPPFIERLGGDINSPTWQEHLGLLSSFWAMQALGELEYRGSPLAPHFNMGLSKEHFERWLELFYETIDEVYTPSAGEFFKQRSSNIARNFMINLGINS